jgi:hypothetical protein
LGAENQNVGLSLMVSIYLVFWMEFATAIRMNGPLIQASNQDATKLNHNQSLFIKEDGLKSSFNFRRGEGM